MAETGSVDTIVGRGNQDGARLFREWFAELTEAAEEDRRGAYVFVMGSFCELSGMTHFVQ